MCGIVSEHAYLTVCIHKNLPIIPYPTLPHNEISVPRRLHIVVTIVRNLFFPACFEIEDNYLIARIDKEAPGVRLRLVASDEGYGFDVRSSVTARGRAGFVLNAQGRLIPLAPFWLKR